MRNLTNLVGLLNGEARESDHLCAEAEDEKRESLQKATKIRGEGAQRKLPQILRVLYSSPGGA